MFEDLSLEMEPGRIYGLLGENGVGKTTLLRIICGLLRAKDGRCTVDGIPSEKRNPGMLSDIYYVPEIFFAPAISVNTFAKSNSLLYPRWDAAQFQKLCLTFEVDPGYRFDKLSHGQQKKALIAFALALNTRILLMDEPSPVIILDRSGLILNASIEQISEKLLFTMSQELDPEAYWSESSLSGYYQVIPNREGMPSRVNLEALFNAALRNKETFKTLFR